VKALNRVVTFKVDEKLLEEARRAAAEEGVTFSELVREALREYIRRRGEPKKITVRRHVLY